MHTFSPEPSGAAVMQALAMANTEAFDNWMALCKETWMRAAAVRNPLEYAAIGNLMLPACASHAMLYCRCLSDIAAGAQAAASRPLAASEAGTPAAAIDLSANAPLRPAVKDSPRPHPCTDAVRQGRCQTTDTHPAVSRRMIRDALYPCTRWPWRCPAPAVTAAFVSVSRSA